MYNYCNICNRCTTIVIYVIIYCTICNRCTTIVIYVIDVIIYCNRCTTIPLTDEYMHLIMNLQYKREGPGQKMVTGN